jgi:hypothetical protein
MAPYHVSASDMAAIISLTDDSFVSALILYRGISGLELGVLAGILDLFRGLGDVHHFYVHLPESALFDMQKIIDQPPGCHHLRHLHANVYRLILRR